MVLGWCCRPKKARSGYEIKLVRRRTGQCRDERWTKPRLPEDQRLKGAQKGVLDVSIVSHGQIVHGHDHADGLEDGRNQ